MSRETTVGALEFAAALALTRVFSEATSLPGEYVTYGMQRFTVVIVSFLLTAAVYIPLYFLTCNIPSGIFSPDRRGKALHGFTTAFFGVFLLAGAADTGLRAHYYASSTVFDSAPSWYFYIFIGAALTFAVASGFGAVSRTALLVAAALVMLFVLMTAALAGEIKPDRLYPALIDDAQTFPQEVIREFSLNGELLIFAALYGRVRGGKRVIPLYLGISCAMILAMTLLYNTVFGYLTSKLDYPFYTLSSVSDITLLHRINGIDVMIWVMAAAVKLALFTFAVRALVRSHLRNAAAVNIITAGFALAALGLSWAFTKRPELFAPIKALCETGLPLVIAALLPLADALPAILRKKRSERI
ncbi:MAG: GerAB/ArcD/ProY family transporter [Ruminiclostridium sp.]|nr:GerAB/ArcD/ProY family transporter [Ruminiclostridium sp.]